MGFKELVEADYSKVFLDVSVFGELYCIEGNEIPIVLDTEELKVRQNGQDLAVAESNTLFYARTQDLPPRRSPGQNLNVNGRECLIDDWKVDMGMATIALRENIIG